ncbi:MAG: hypothetical protein PHN66_00820 [Candidatus Shapirobacteria bacterium]|nr:hypothetical protein [Candidatus Shapirobacteria bacterium]
MTKLSKQTIEEYRQIYLEEYGKEISFEEAEKQGTNLVELFRLLIKVDQKPKN